jgi:hypothetical protein
MRRIHCGLGRKPVRDFGCLYALFMIIFVTVPMHILMLIIHHYRVAVFAAPVHENPLRKIEVA